MIDIIKQMVDALEWCYGGEPVNTAEAIQAGKQLIAELESQEPVAWRTFDGEGQYQYRAYEENESYVDDWDKRNPNHKGWVEPLYTHPPQRKPLTDEQIDALWVLTPDEWDDCNFVLYARITRIIEAAHGIKEES